MGKTMIICLLFVVSLYAQKMRIIVPYYGAIHNTLTVQNMSDLEDSAPMGGLYFQCVDPGRRQWNLFLYGSRDINKSDIRGAHFIYDYYFGSNPKGQFAMGGGFETIQIKTDGDVSSSLQNFKMTNNIYAPFFRFGKYFNFGSEMKKISILPWMGYEQDIIRGDLGFILPSMNPGMPAVSVKEDINADYHYALTGINFKWSLYHFVELSVKYYRKISLDDQEDLNTVSGMVNVYLNRHWGLSYRFKTMEVSVSKNTYHIGGLAFVF